MDAASSVDPFFVRAENPEGATIGEGLAGMARSEREAVEKLHALVSDLAQRMRPVLREEMAECVDIDRQPMRPDCSPLTAFANETIGEIHSVQRRVVDLLARLDLP